MQDPKTDRTWSEYWLGGAFLAILMISVIGIVLDARRSELLSIVAIVMAGCLLLIVSLPRIQEFSIGREGVRARLSELDREVDRQRTQVNEQQDVINTLVRYSVSASIFRHLCGIGLLREYKYHDDLTNRREFYFLRDNGSIRPRGGGFLEFDEKLDGRNVAEVAEPTPIGWICLKLRKNEIPPEMLNDKPNLKVSLADL